MVCICFNGFLSYFNNVILPPKEDILYLYKDINGIRFIDKHANEVCSLKPYKENVGTFYKVYRSVNYVYKVVGESKEKREQKMSKISYPRGIAVIISLFLLVFFIAINAYCYIKSWLVIVIIFIITVVISVSIYKALNKETYSEYYLIDRTFL